MTEPVERLLCPENARSPLVIAGQNTTDAIAWIQANRQELLRKLATHGALLFREFSIVGAHEFERFSAFLVNDWMGYQDRASRRSAVQGNIFTSTDTPAAFSIALHNESSFTARWPRKVFFYCEVPPESGGRTPIADVRQVYLLLDPALRAKFEEHGVMYVRNFGPGVGMDWRDVFQVESREYLEAFCQDNAIATEWTGDGRLRTTQVRPATLRHPETNETVWFNHAMALHPSSLDPGLRAALLRQNGESNLPHNTYFGNGDPLSDDDIEQVRQAYQDATFWFAWRKGDILMLDNILCAHGREPYSGHRSILAAMADPDSWNNHAIALTLPDHLPRSQAASDNFSSQALVGAAAAANVEELRDWLFAAVVRELQIDRATAEDNFTDLGGDSLSAVALSEEAFKLYGVELEIDLILGPASLGEISTALALGLRKGFRPVE